MSNSSLPGNLKRLPDALRALPQVAPERSAWPEIAARLQREAAAAAKPPRRMRRWLIPAALAAGLALVALAMLRWHETAGPDPAVATAAPHGASRNNDAANGANATNGNSDVDPKVRLASLQQRSQALEHWLHETAPAAAPLAGQDLAAAAELEDMIGFVDLQLNAAPRDAELALWHRRVALLEDLTALRYASYSLAEAGVATAASMPANLTN